MEAIETPGIRSTTPARRTGIAIVLGGIVGFGIGWGIFHSLLYLSPFVIHPVPQDGGAEGKGAYMVEALWFWCGIPWTTLVGMIWPVVIAPKVRRLGTRGTMGR